MSAIAVAIGTVGAAVVGGISSRNASKRAAETAADTTADQLAYMQAAENRARDDINRLFPQATERRAQGMQQQMDFLSSALPTTMNFMQQGNVGAQNVLAGSMPQIQNAILGGGPIDYGFMQPQQIDYQQPVQDLLAGLPQVWQEPVPEPAAGDAIPQQPNVPRGFDPFNMNDPRNEGGAGIRTGGRFNIPWLVRGFYNVP